jgi:hypothetical protein
MEDILRYLNDNKFEEIIKIKNYNTIRIDDNNILELLAIRGNEKGIDFFIKDKLFDINKGNINGQNIIHLLFRYGFDKLAEKYYKLYSNLLFHFDSDIYLPIIYCIDRFDTFSKCFDYMIKINKDIDIYNNVSIFNDNLFSKIIDQNENKEKYSELLIKNIDLIDFEKPKMSPILIQSIKLNRTDLIEYFIKNNKGIDIKDYAYLLPINIASQNNNINVVKLILEKNDNIGYGGINNEYLPLNIAINNNFIDLALILVEHIKNYNTIDRYKNTYLHYIADKLLSEEIKNTDIEKKLKHILKKIILKVNIDYKNIDNITPRQLLTNYIKMKKNNDIMKILSTISKEKDSPGSTSDRIDIINNKTKFKNGLFISDIFHNMIYCIYLLNKYDNLMIPFYKFDKNKYMENISNFNMINIPYDKHFKLMYEILNVTNKYLYPLLPSVIIWKSKDLNYINEDLFQIIKNTLKFDGKRFIMIKITLVIGVQYTHANVILIDLKDNSIRRFEPYGISDIDDEFYLDKIIHEKVSEVLDRKMKYYSPSDYLDLSKFQLISNDGNNNYRKAGDPGGYCLAWCFWYVELKMNNSEIDEEKLMIKAGNKITKYYKNTDNPYLYFIRDYSRKLNDEKDKILKKIKFKNNELYDINYKISNLEKVLLYMIHFFNKFN